MDEVGNIVGRLAAKVLADTGTDIGSLLDQSLGRVLRIAVTKGIPIDVADPRYRHVCDWLVAAVVNGEHWLSRTDADGVPFKLAKFGTLQQVLDEADKSIRRQNTRAMPRASGGEVVYSFEDGWTVVRLKTEEELDHESAEMQHCVGQGGYDAAVKAGRKSIFSLRDPSSGSHVTVEMENVAGGLPVIEQIKGKQNRLPRTDYFERVITWLDTLQGYEFACDDCPDGWAVAKSGKLVNLRKLPPGAIFHGNVTCGFIDDEDGREVELSLPQGIVIDGNLTVFGQWKHTLAMPEHITVSGDCYIRGMTVDTASLPGRAVYLEDCCINGLPRRIGQAVSIATSTFGEKFIDGAGVRFGIFTSLSNSHIDAAVGKMTFAGDLDLHAITGSIGRETDARLRVPGNLRISGSKLKMSGEIEVGGSMSFNRVTADWGSCAVTIGGDLRLHRSDVGCLPAKLAVRGSLEVSDCGSMGSLPGNVLVERNVSITATDLSLGNRRFFNGDLHLARYEHALPDGGIAVVGSLRMEQCGLGKLPTGMKVGGDVTLEGMPNITEVPFDLVVGRNFKITSAGIVTIPAGMDIPGDLDIRFQPSFTMPDGVRIGGSLIAWAAGIRSLPRDLMVRDVLATESRLEYLPKGFNIDGNLDVSKTPMTRFPEDAFIGGDVDMRGTEITDIPETSVVRGKVYSDDAPTEDAEVLIKYRAAPAFQ